MTTPTPTTTAQATVSSTRMPLTEEQLNHALETLADIAAGKLGAYYVAELAQHIDALTEQVRVLEQRRGCRRPATGYTDLATPECEWHEDVEMLITAIEDAHAKVFPEWGELDGDESGVYLMTQALQRITDTALAALEGSGE